MPYTPITTNKKTGGYTPITGSRDEEKELTVAERIDQWAVQNDVPVLSSYKPGVPEKESFLKRTARVLLPKSVEEKFGMNKEPDAFDRFNEAEDYFNRVDVVGGLKTGVEALKYVPQQLKSAFLQIKQGGASGASVANKDKSDLYIEKAQKDLDKFLQETEAKYGKTRLMPGIKITDVASLPQNLAFSGLSMGAGLSAVPLASIPFAGPVLAWTVGTTAAGKTAYEMSTYQITQKYLEAKNEEQIKLTGFGLTEEQEENLKDEFALKGMQYGLFEAIPEALSSAVGLKLLTAPLKAMIGNSLATQVASKVAGLYGEEMLTETITQMGQKNVEISAGLLNEAPKDWLKPEDWTESFKEIAPQTFLLTTLLAGAGQTIVSTKNAYTKVRNSLVNELVTKGMSVEQAETMATQGGFVKVPGLDLKNPIDTIKEIADTHTKQAKEVLADPDLTPEALAEMGGEEALAERARTNLADGLEAIKNTELAEAVRALPIDENTTVESFTAEVNSLVEANKGMITNKVEPTSIVEDDKKEEDKSLLAVHNLSEEKLRFADKIGGLANPSMAVINPKVTSFENYGDISLIGNKDLIEGEKTRLSDAYTARFPSVHSSMSFADFDNLQKEFEPYYAKIGKDARKMYQDNEDMVRVIENNSAVALKFLEENNVEPSKEGESYYHAQIKEAGLDGKFQEYLDGIYEKYNLKEQMFAGYTNSGQRRYRPVTVDEASKIMSKQKDEGYNYGLGSIRSKISPVKTSTKEIKKEAGRLISKEDFENIKKSYGDELFALREKLSKYAKVTSDNSFIEFDSQLNAIGELLMGQKDGRYYFNSKYPEAPESLVNDVLKFRDKLKKMPTEYFETKFQRPVKLSEFRIALVPDTITSEAKAILQKQGLEIREYPKGGKAKVMQDLLKSDVSFKKPIFSKLDGPKLSNEQIKQIVRDELADPKLRVIFTDELIDGVAVGTASKNSILGDIIKLYEEGGKTSLLTALHETKHLIFNGLDKAIQKEAIALAKAEIGPIEKTELKLAYKDLDENGILEEYIVEKWARSTASEKYGYKKSAWDKIFDALDQFLKKIIDTYKKIKTKSNEISNKDTSRIPRIQEVRETSDTAREGGAESAGKDNIEIRGKIEKYITKYKIKQSIFNIFNDFSKLKQGESIDNPQGEISSGLILNKDISEIIDTNEQELFFTRMSLKHLAEKGEEGKRLLKAVPEILDDPDTIHRNITNGRFLISSEKTNKKFDYSDTIVLELQKIGNDIIITVMPTKSSYFDNIERFELLWRGAVSPSRIPKGGAGSPTISGRIADQKIQSKESILPPQMDVKDTEDIEAIYQEEYDMDKEQMEKALEEYMAESFPKPIKAFSKAPMESFVAKLTPEKFSLLTPTQQSIVAKFDTENRFAQQITEEEIRREIGTDLSPTEEAISEILATKSEKAGEKIKDGKIVPIRKVIRKKIRLGERATEFRDLLGDDLYYKINTEDSKTQSLEEVVERINEKQADQITIDDFLEAMYRTIKGKSLLTKAQRDVRRDFQEARQEQSRKRYNLTQLAKKIEKERTRKEELVFKLKGEGKAKLEKVITEEREKRSRAVVRIMQQNEIIKTNLNNLVKIRQIRAEKIDIVQEYFGLSDKEMAKVRGQKNIQMMSDAEFNVFLTEVSNKAQLEAERIEALVQLKGTIYGLELQNVDNLRKVMSYPVIEKMSIKQLKDFDALLSEYEFRDEFLSERKLETIDKTDFKGVKTIREAREKVAEKVGVQPGDLKIDVSEFDRFRFDTALAEKDPFYKYFVEGFSASILEGDATFAEEQHKIDELFGKARKGKGIVGAIIPQDQKVMAYLESENKEEAAKGMTPDEIKAAEYVRLKLGEAYAYELETQMLKKSSYEDIYVPHIQRTFLEAIKDSGFKVAMKEMLDQHKIDEKIMTILDQKTGDILPMEKFFRFAMYRTGGVIPTQNVARAFLAYMRAFERKRALDRIIPEIMTAVDVVSPREMTEKGLAMDDTLKTFVKEYLNTKKGRPVKMFVKPGGKIDWVLRAVKGFTYLMDLGFNIPVQIASQGGVQVGVYVLLGTKNYFKGWKRLVSKQGRVVAKKYESYTERTPWDSLKDASVGLGDKMYSLMFALFRDASVRGNKIQLLGSLTTEEFTTGEVTPKRLAELKTDLGRWLPVEGSGSILGSTT